MWTHWHAPHPEHPIAWPLHLMCQGTPTTAHGTSRCSRAAACYKATTCHSVHADPDTGPMYHMYSLSFRTGLHHINNLASPVSTYLYPTMSGCARAANGDLLDASEIVWYHDADDDIPMPGPRPAVTPTTFSTRPTRTRMPSSKLTGDNSEAPALASHKDAIRLQAERSEARAHLVVDNSLSGTTRDTSQAAKCDADMASISTVSATPDGQSEDENPRRKLTAKGHFYYIS
jgi:hypothetical protein